MWIEDFVRLFCNTDGAGPERRLAVRGRDIEFCREK